MRILNKVPKSHNARHGKGGFTLVELCVVLALLAILAAAISSFSVLMNRYAVDASQETDFWEDNAALKKELRNWIAENDVKSINGDEINPNTFTVQSGSLTVEKQDKSTESLSFANGVLTVGEKQIEGFDTIDGVEFSVGTGYSIIKCTVYHITESGERKEADFLFSCRSASVSYAAGGDVNG